MDLSTDPGSYSKPRSPSVENKRANKPLVERKRRGRINKSIDELKEIVLQALNKDDKDYCKMEKADILEMVVRHLKAIRRNQIAVDSMGDPSPVWNNYRAGFNECASEVMQYMRASPGVEPTVQMRMLSHLADCIQRVNAFPPVEPLNTTAHINHPMTSRVTSPQQQHMTTSQMMARMTPPSRTLTTSPTNVSAPLTTRIVVSGIPAGTPDTSLPGSIAPNVCSIKQETERSHFGSTSGSSFHPVNPKPQLAMPRVDQIVPGSSQSPELDLENASMVDPIDLHNKVSHYKVIGRCHSPELRIKSHKVYTRPTSTSSPPYSVVRNTEKKSDNVLQEVAFQRVWRPW